MSVIFEVPVALVRYSNSQISLELEGENVQETLDNLWLRFPELRKRVLDDTGELFPYLLLFRNGRKLPRNDFSSIAVVNGDKLELIALAEGG